MQRLQACPEPTSAPRLIRLRFPRRPRAGFAVARRSTPSRSSRERDAAAVERRRYRARGVVQGVGFRPFVHGLATRLELAGYVAQRRRGRRRRGRGATVDTLDAFGAALVTVTRQPLARVEELATESVPSEEIGASSIAKSRATGGSALVAARRRRRARTACASCYDPADRRYRTPSSTARNAGPRFTIVRARALRPADARRWPASRCATTADARTKIPPIAASTPSRSPARSAARGSPCRSTTAVALTPGRRDRRRQGPRWLPPRLRRDERGGRGPSCARASTARTSRSRS